MVFQFTSFIGGMMRFQITGLLISVCLTVCLLSSCGGEPEKPDLPSTTFFTKDLKDRGGETLAQLAKSLNDPSAFNCAVAPIDNIDSFPKEYLDNYIIGVDLSTIIEIERLGGKFYDNDRYYVGDVIELLSYYGVNWIRARLWNDPYSSDGKSFGAGDCDLETVMKIGKRAKKWGMKFLLDFHYSDFWAHPGQQARPREWVKYRTADELAPVLKNWTKDALYIMRSFGGFLPDMIQIGNETNKGFCGFYDAGYFETIKLNEKKLLAAGLEAVREISEEFNYPILTMIHAAININLADRYMNTMLNSSPALQFDVLGFSYYPDSHAERDSYSTRADFEAGLQSLADKYKMPICLAEYQIDFTNQNGFGGGDLSYSNTNTMSFIDTGTDRTLSGQAQAIRNMNNAVMNNTVSGGVRYGIGSFWWEAAWLPVPGTNWRSPASREWYEMDLPGKPAVEWVDWSPSVACSKAFFSFNGTALPSLNVFLQMMGKEPRPAS